ncbi:hypothetical protein PVAG01_09067 [Phlyctema vagabunda]|uniref:Ankyrin repeat protein n=1 Tax=Phlyctema vagabunda TaxID=108571 RepID=A0ABR4P6B7_9HELO
MAAIGQYIYNYLSVAMSSTILDDAVPSVADVLKVKQYFIDRAALPIELIDTILDHAEYWPCTSTSTSGRAMASGRYAHRNATSNENKFLLRSFPLGFSPSSSHYQISKPDLNEYASKQPSPWPDSKEVPQNATEELLENWKTRTSATTEHPCRKIVFTIKSRDQGAAGEFGTQGTYNHSYSWFEAGLEKVSALKEKHVLEAWKTAPRPQFEVVPHTPDDATPPVPIICSLRTIEPATIPIESPNIAEDEGAGYIFQQHLHPSTTRRIQSNVVAQRQQKEHVVTWSCFDDMKPDSPGADELESIGRGPGTGDGEFVRNMRVGDVVTIWAKARFPGWQNNVESVKVDVYWAI